MLFVVLADAALALKCRAQRHSRSQIVIGNCIGKFYCAWNIKRHGPPNYMCIVAVWKTNTRIVAWIKTNCLPQSHPTQIKENTQYQQQQQLDLFMIIGLNYTNFPVFGNLNVLLLLLFWSFVSYFEIIK